MASACAASLALADAGVPIESHVRHSHAASRVEGSDGGSDADFARAQVAGLEGKLAEADQRRQEAEGAFSSAQQRAQEIGAAFYAECSATTGEGVEQLFERAGREAVAHQTGAARGRKGKKCTLL